MRSMGQTGDWWEPPTMLDVISPGSLPNARVDHINLTEYDVRAYNALHKRRNKAWMAITPGRYVRLQVKGAGTMMSDTPMERRTNTRLLKDAHGDVLIGGLGIGMLPAALLRTDRPTHRAIRSVTVLELESDVIRLVAPHLRDPRLTVVQADVFTWTPPEGALYDTIYWDIWPEITDDNLPGMQQLHRRYLPYLRADNPRATMESWLYTECQKMKTKGGW